MTSSPLYSVGSMELPIILARFMAKCTIVHARKTTAAISNKYKRISFNIFFLRSFFCSSSNRRFTFITPFLKYAKRAVKAQKCAATAPLKSKGFISRVLLPLLPFQHGHADNSVLPFLLYQDELSQFSPQSENEAARSFLHQHRLKIFGR